MRSIKRVGLIVVVILIIAGLCLICRKIMRNSREVMGFRLSDFRVEAEEDTHGGFHGDGDHYLILDCSSDPDKAKIIVQEWKPLPLSENLELIMFGGTKNGVSYGFDLAKNAHLPEIQNGYYRFEDKQSKDPSDDSGLLGRVSFNFRLAVYDLDTNKLYYFEFDT